MKHPFEALPDTSYVKNFYDRTRDLIDQHNPDLLYFDNSLLPLGWGGMNIGAYFYNNNLKTHGGRMEAVMNIKEVPDHLAKSVVADYERGLTSGIMLYFSHSDWYDADFRPYGWHPLQVPSSPQLWGLPTAGGTVEEFWAGMKKRLGGRLMIVPDPTREHVNRIVERHRAQLTELLTRYGTIDMTCLDIFWGPHFGGKCERRF